jgi:ABC-type oligopeptide transport system ATPase subunit
MKKILILTIGLLLIVVTVRAQDSRTVSTNSAKRQSFEAYKIESKQRLDAFNNHPINLYYDHLIVEYQKRMKANVKKHKVIARKMKKPQYSDPSYFGHKRKPKKREVGKRKYCKECEIVH